MAKAFSNKIPLINGYLDELQRRFNLYTYREGQETRKGRDTAFEVFSIAIVLGKSFQDAYDNGFVNGDKDGGIDGVYFEKIGEGTVHMHVFQSKNNKGLRDNELDKFKSDFKEIFEAGDPLGKRNVEDLQDKIAEYKQLTSDLISVVPKLYYVYNGENDDPQYPNNSAVFSAHHQPHLDFEIWDSDALYKQIGAPEDIRGYRKELTYTFQPTSSSLTPKDVQDLYSYSIGDVRAVNFRMEAVQLCQLVEKEIEQNGSDVGLFAANIRNFLGDAVKANRKMKDTLSKPAEAIYFPFLNNGITAVCEKLSIPVGPQDGKYLIPTVNPIIVNGLQTSKVLYRTYKTDERQLLGIYVNIRIYETQDPALVERITDATNTQSPIYYKDKVSNKDFNQWVKELFRTKGVFYLTKRGDSAQSLRAKQEQIDNDLVLKFWFATFYEQPEMAKSSKASVLETVYEASNALHPLHELFSGQQDSPLYVQLVIAYFIYKKVMSEEQAMRKQYSYIGHAKELLSYGLYKAAEQNLNALYHDDPQTLDAAYQTALNTLAQSFKQAEEEYTKNKKFLSIPGYFKSARSRYDYNRVAGISETTSGIINELLQKHIG